MAMPSLMTCFYWAIQHHLDAFNLRDYIKHKTENNPNAETLEKLIKLYNNAVEIGYFEKCKNSQGCSAFFKEDVTAFGFQCRQMILNAREKLNQAKNLPINPQANVVSSAQESKLDKVKKKLKPLIV